MRLATPRAFRRLALAGLVALAAGCANDAQTGAGLGAVLGALAGNALGHDSEATAIGAGIGAGAGYMIGNESDKARSGYRYRYNPDCDY